MSTFGNLNTGTTPTDNPSNAFVWAKALSTPATDGSLTSISVYGQIKAGSPVLGVALYTDSAGAPGSKLGAEETTMGSFAAGFGVVTTTLATPIAITAGVQYWFAFRMPGNTGGATPDSNIYAPTNGGLTNAYFTVNGAGNPFPSSAGSPTASPNEDYAVFGTYTPSGATTAQQIPAFVETASGLLVGSVWN